MENANKKILIIESDSNDQNSMRDILARVGHRNILSASTGKEGVELTEFEKPDIIITALVLPDYTGFEVCKRIRALAGEAIKIILITGKLNVVEPEWIGNTQADVFITKSADYETLVQAISKLL